MDSRTDQPNRAIIVRRASGGISSIRDVGVLLRASCSYGVLAASAGLLFVGASSPAFAGSWNVTPKLEVRETYTDNVFLSPTDAEEDFITTASPGVSINRDGRRFQINADYTLNYLYFANTEEDDIRHNLTAAFQSEVVRDLFFFEGSASVNQQFLDRTGPISFNDANLTDNRATIQAYRLSPYMLGRLGQALEWEARYNFSYLVSDQGTIDSAPGQTLSDGQGHEASGKIGTASDATDLYWTLSGTMSRFKRESGSSDFDRDSVTLGAGYKLSRKFAITGAIGYYGTNLQNLSQDTEGLIWNAGFAFAPGPRTSLSANYGRRIDDETFAGSFAYRVSSTSTFNINYSDTFQNSQGFITSLLNNIPSSSGEPGPSGGFNNNAGASGLSFLDGSVGFSDGVSSFVDADGVPGEIGSPGFTIDDRTFRSQRATAGWTFSKNKTGVTFNGYYEIRNFDQATSDKEKSLGASLSLLRRLSRASSISVGGQYRRVKVLNLAQTDNNFSVRARFEHRLSKRLSAYAQVFHYQRMTNSGAGDDVQESGATISVKATF